MIDPSSYRKSVSAVQRYNTWTYHCRPRYAIHRVQTLSEQLNSVCFARWRVRRLVAELDRQDRERNPLNDRPQRLKAV